MVITFLLWFWSFSFQPHPIHVSVSEVEISDHEVIWTARIYTDDLLLAVYGKNANSVLSLEPEKVNRDIHRYLTKSIDLIQQGASTKWILSDIQPDPEAIWITVKGHWENGTTSFQIGNSILSEVYKDQKNIVNIRTADKSKNLVFEYRDKLKDVNL